MDNDTLASTRVRQRLSGPLEAVFAAFTRPAEIREWHVPGPDFTVGIANGDSTEVTVRHDLLPDQQSAEDHTHGWTGTLKSLARAAGRALSKAWQGTSHR